MHVTGFRFDLAGPAGVSPSTVELDGVSLIGHRLRIILSGQETDLFIVGATWSHTPGGLSKSGLLTLSEAPA